MFTSRFFLFTLAALPQLLQAQATVTLTTSANPSPLSAPLTLTATVPGGGSTGRVTFFDGVNILGVKPLAAGSASLSTSLLSAGSHKITAYYRDPTILAAGTSNAVIETVRAAAVGVLVPQAPANIPLSILPNTLVIADFNGDGKPDLASPIPEYDAWWQVDLGAPSAIGSIAVWNRTDCCSDRLTDYWVFVSDTPFDPSDTPASLEHRNGTYSSHQTTAPNPSATIPVNGISGRYVRVQLSGSGYLNLAEVQVFGAGAQATTNLAQGKLATQSSTLPGETHRETRGENMEILRVFLCASASPRPRNRCARAGAASAVDGNTDGDFLHGSVTSTSGYLVKVALGKGDGTFQAPVSYSASDGVMAPGDFDGDGNTDLALYDQTHVTVLLGNGDGTFRPGTSYPVNDPAPTNVFYRLPNGGIAVGDFNGDGAADIVTGVGYYCCGPHGNEGSWSFPATLLPGNGDGTFGAARSYPGVPPPYAMADYNNDGKPDIAGGAILIAGLPVVLGNGDGTGTIAGQYPLGLFFNSSNAPLLTADFNGDGKPDLVSGRSVLLGKGDGSFQAPIPISGSAMSAGDFNGDGILDLVAGSVDGNPPGILYGNGDGTFRQGLALPYDISPIASADFNGDGQTDILARTSSGIAVLLSTAGYTLSALGGTPQSAVLGAPFSQPLQAILKDANGHPAGGMVVTFEAPTVGPSARLSGATAVTNAEGVAGVEAGVLQLPMNGVIAIANNIPGSYRITASVGSVSTSFSLTNVLPPGPHVALGRTAVDQRAGTFSSVRNAAPNPSTAIPVNAQGRYVRVQLINGSYPIG